LELKLPLGAVATPHTQEQMFLNGCAFFGCRSMQAVCFEVMVVHVKNIHRQKLKIGPPETN
jgi:hypothetical protein